MIEPVLLSPDVEGWVDEGIELVRTQTDLTEFDVHSPERAFIELMVYERERIVEAVNLIPRQLLIDILTYIGFEPRTGVKATGEVTFTISISGSDFVISPGYALTDGTHIFYTTETLNIPAGQTEGTVTIIAADFGTDYNVAIGTINQAVGIKYAIVVSISNNSVTSGGLGEEPDDDAIQRSTLSFNLNQALITVADYQNAVMSYGGLRAKVLTNTNDLKQEEIGSQLILTHGLDSTQRSDFLTTIEDRLPIGVTTYIDDLDILDLEITLDLRVEKGYDLPTLAQEMFDTLALKYNPKEAQDGLIWQSQIVANILTFGGVVGCTLIGIDIGNGVVYGSDVELNPNYAEVNLTTLTLNFDDGINQQQIIVN